MANLRLVNPTISPIRSRGRTIQGSVVPRCTLHWSLPEPVLLGWALRCSQLLCAYNFARWHSQYWCHFSNLVNNVKPPRYRLSLFGTDGALGRSSPQTLWVHFNFAHRLWKSTKKIHARLALLQTCFVVPDCGRSCFSHPEMVHRGETLAPEATGSDINLRQTRFKATEELCSLATTAALLLQVGFPGSVPRRPVPDACRVRSTVS